MSLKLQKPWYNRIMSEREDKIKTHRIIQIDEDIRSGMYPSVQYLVKKYEVSKRTILRDIEFYETDTRLRLNATKFTRDTIIQTQRLQ